MKWKKVSEELPPLNQVVFVSDGRNIGRSMRYDENLDQRERARNKDKYPIEIVWSEPCEKFCIEHAVPILYWIELDSILPREKCQKEKCRLFRGPE